MNDQFRKQKIRELNDKLRTTFAGGRVMLTRGVQSEGQVFGILAARKVMMFTDFNPGNDPHEQHDFGQVEVQGSQVFWKIDYLDHDLQMHSPDEADETVTTRVLTIMLSHDL